MNRLFLVLMLGMLLVLPIMSAYEGHKQNTPLTVTLTSNNATECSILSVQYPPGNTINTNLSMTKFGESFSRTLNQSNYTELGDVCHFVSCFDGVEYETGSICRTITPSGFTDTLGFYFLILLIAGAFVMLGFYIGDGWFVVAGGMLFVLIGLYTIIFGIAGQKDIMLTWGLGLFEVFMGAYLSMRASLEMMD